MRPFLYLLLSAAILPAGVVLNQPTAQSGFFDGYSDYYYLDGTGLLSGVSSAALPAANGLTAQKIFGQATMPANGEYSPYIVMIAEGTAFGTFTVDTQVAVHFDFNTPGLSEEIPFYVQGELGTSNGYYTIEWSLFSADGGTGSTAFLEKNGYIKLSPAGTEVYSWRVAVGAGSYGSPYGPPSLTLNIPANSIELVATTSGTPVPSAPAATGEVPEPATVILLATGVSVLIARRLRHPV